MGRCQKGRIPGEDTYAYQPRIYYLIPCILYALSTSPPLIIHIRRSRAVHMAPGPRSRRLVARVLRAALQQRMPRFLRGLFFFCLIPFGSHAQVLRSIFFQLHRQCGSDDAAAEQFSMWPEWTSFQWMTQLPRSPANNGHSPASSARQTRRARMQFASVASEGHSTSDVVCMCCCSQYGSRKPRVASAVTQSGPVPCRSRCERAVDGPFESGGARVEVSMEHRCVCMDRTPL